jgi:dolichyl-phosphate-mannose-protein mannosyltransferase
MARQGGQEAPAPGSGTRLLARGGVPVAAGLAFAGQFLISLRSANPTGTLVAGFVLYAAAVVLAVLALLSGRRVPVTGCDGWSERHVAGRAGWILFGLVLAGGLWLRLARIDVIPWGLNNDEAINAIEVEEINAGKPFATLTERGLNRETMFHQLAAFSYRHPGLGLNLLRSMPPVFDLNKKFIEDPVADRVFPLRFVSIVVGTLTLALLFLFARQACGARIALVATLFMAVSPWHLLYSRVGFRVILAPAFAIVTGWLFLRAWRTGRWIDHLAWGAAAGLGFWTYTSFRCVPIALAAFVLLSRRRAAGRGGLRAAVPWSGLAAGVALAGLFFLGIMAFSGMTPMQFLFRGAYATTPPETSWFANLLHAVTMLNYYPSRYAVIQSDAFISDGVSATFGLIGLEPDTLLLAAFATLGFVVAGLLVGTRPRPGRTGAGDAAPAGSASAGAAETSASAPATVDPAPGLANAMALSLLMILASWLTIGWMGPSLTRLLITLPWIALSGALVAVRVWDDLASLWRPVTAWVAAAVVAGIAALACAQGYSNYFLLAGRSERAMQHFGATQTVMGMFARSLPPTQDLVVLHTLRVDTLHYLIGNRPNVTMLTDTTKVSLDSIVKTPRSITFIVEYARPFAEPLRSLMMRFPQGDMTQVADARIDPDKIIFFTFTLWKDASGQIVTPPGGPPPQGMPPGMPPEGMPPQEMNPQGMTPGTPAPAPPPGSAPPG